jgi:hypothetical protein
MRYIWRELHIYIEREKEREGESDKEIEKTDSCCNIPHPYVPIPTPGNTEKQTHGH